MPLIKILVVEEMFVNYIILIKNKNFFPQVLQVKAVDGDRGINNAIKYAITGGPQHTVH